jgi:predicted GH43/DUF377 family glycosyl hydrolase
MYRLFWLLACLLLSLSAAAAQESPLFEVAGDEPAVPRGERPIDWDSPYTDPGAVLYHEGQFHMLRNGFKGWPASVQVGYLTSEDGMTWTEVTPDPVLHTDDVPFAEIAALASSALVEDDGMWVLYFYTWNTRSGGGGGSEIGRATAADPLGPWTVDPEPILTRGEAGAWDSATVNAPSVVKTEDGAYFMYYAGGDETQGGGIGLATSEDGVTWTKHGDPVLTATEDWEGAFIHQPRVVQTPEGWVMLYRSQGTGRGQMRLGLATSEDGITWTKSNHGAIWQADNVPGGVAFWMTALAYHDNAYYLYVETTPASRRNETNIWAAVHEGSLMQP